MSTTHIMIDLETWGCTPGSDIRSIGAVVFDLNTGALGSEFYVNIQDLGHPFTGLTRDASTVKWWSEQSVEAQRALDDDQVALPLALVQFAHWWQSLDGETKTFWAHGPHFDETILGACFRACGLPVPWHYRAARDCRTIWEAAGGVDLPFEGVQHDALADAKHQARCVIEAYRVLRAPAEEPVQ